MFQFKRFKDVGWALVIGKLNIRWDNLKRKGDPHVGLCYRIKTTE